MKAGLLRSIVLMSAGLACQPSPSAPDSIEEPRPDAGSNENPLCPGPAAPDTAEAATLSLPARTRSTLSGSYIASIERSTPTRVVAESEVALAVGPGYPSSVTMALDTVVDPRCCCDSLGSMVTIDGISAVEGAVDVMQTGPTTLVASVSEEGRSSFEVTGVISAPAGQLIGCSAYEETRELPVTLLMRLRAERPRWRIEAPERCGARTVIQENRPLPVTTVALDAAGLPFYPLNVEHAAVTAAGAGVRLRAPEGGAPSDIVATGEGRVAITVTDGGASHEVSVIPAARIDAMDVVFAIPGFAGGGVTLMDGETRDGFHRAGNRVVAVISRLASGADTLCSEARTEDFRVTSSTPETCAVDGRLCDSIEIPRGDLLTRSAKVVADGACAVRVDAPAFAGGVGLDAEISVTLLDTRTMTELTP